MLSTRLNISKLFLRRLCVSPRLPTLSAEPAVLELKDGTVIPYPRGSQNEIKAYEVYEYGERAVEQFLPEIDDRDKLYNQAKLRYLEMRHVLLPISRGKWMAVNPEGSYVVAANEKLVRRFADLVFPFRCDDYYANCIGYEVLRGAVMDSSASSNPSINDDVGFEMPPGVSSAVTPSKSFVIKAEHSFTGEDFKSYLMKHDTGASMMGVPRDVLSNATILLDRAEDMYYVGPSGRRTVARVYQNNYIRIAGRTFQVPVIAAREWLLGYSILSHFRNIIDVSAKEVVSLDPLS